MLKRRSRIRIKGTKEQRKAIADTLRDYRKLDRDFPVEIPLPIKFLSGKGRAVYMNVYRKDRGVREYEDLLHLGKDRLSLKDIVQRHIDAKKRPVRILDVGCGNAKFLSELREIFGDRVVLEGIALARPFSPEKVEEIMHEHLKGKNRLIKRLFAENAVEEAKAFWERVKKHRLKVHVGLAETHKYEQKYDLIFSTTTFVHAVDVGRVLINTLNHLAEGGEAYIQCGSRNPLNIASVHRWLKNKNIEVVKLGRGVYLFRKKKK
jgi:SAM-dependent methyltransferase